MPRRCQPADVSLPAETTATLDELAARDSFDVVVPGKPFCVSLQYARCTETIEGRPAAAAAERYVPVPRIPAGLTVGESRHA